MSCSIRVTLFCLLLFLVQFSGRVCWELSTVVCKVPFVCGCEQQDFRPDLAGLECDLSKNLYGQHLAKEVLVTAIRRHVENSNPEKPLVLNFIGGSGTGKTFVTSMVVKRLYKAGLASPYVHQFSPRLHFPYVEELEKYKKHLKSWIEGNLTVCGRSVFIFDEIDQMPPGLIDVIEPFLGGSWVVYGSNYRRSFFIFISTRGEEQINHVAVEFWKAQKDREEIELQDLESSLSKAIYNDQKSGLWHSKVIEKNLFNFLVPFLPLRPHHVRECVKSELRLRGMPLVSRVVDSVVTNITFFLNDMFSSIGCKTVAAKLNIHL
ncbi:prosalusin [Protopterus annectens]|uniref:prosalusin n=1 Tax=Protopterus annectens TaxID=7888 RepID=UPI001CFAAF0E|nr:prosalusin [Protopterus annectens]